ncbi:MAG: hypothetical protein AAF719_03520 [Pseudomonadota bacterium]
MLAKLTSSLALDDRAELAARFSAWWEGADYVPGQAAKTEPPKRTKRQKSRSRRPAPPPPPRIKALETLWGRGRLTAGTGDYYDYLLNAFGFGETPPPLIGLLGADAALGHAVEARFDVEVRIAEWREDCAARTSALAHEIDVVDCDLDRMKAFDDDELGALLSIEAFSFADHKAGLAARAFRALEDGGRWVMIDYARTTAKAPPAAFASAWAEPQLPANGAIKSVLEATGFVNVTRRDATPHLLEAAKRGFDRLAGAMEDAIAAGVEGRDGAKMLQELSWEAESWRARINALKGGALNAEMWIADKPGGETRPVGEEPAPPVAAPEPTAEAASEAAPEAARETEIEADLEETPETIEEPSAEAPEIEEEASADLDEVGDAAEWGLEEDDAEAMGQGAVDSLFD